jgi:hypothetical protein
MVNNQRTDFLSGREGTLAVRVKSDWENKTELLATGDSRLGKGTLGAIPLHLVFKAENLQLRANQPRKFKVELEVSTNAGSKK